MLIYLGKNRNLSIEKTIIGKECKQKIPIENRKDLRTLIL
ncbi:hypothetical protein FLJC2902T_28330 [Flavobacterium limnosediminis JC2902]|uniref:Uncharacterized protein n=1 Tax=Flavobacterium limnosediminis JC2902 TaxID=1341181 RepID=V6SPK7_9FLAO|nr:hypothetical protein FLJC2902T_28330 [Flavobacterium limnosediminis JC2902]